MNSLSKVSDEKKTSIIELHDKLGVKNKLWK